MVDKTDKPPAKPGTDEAGTQPKWQELGFKDEAEMIESAQEAKDLRGKIEAKEADFEKEKSAKGKLSSDFMRQSNEVGELKKKLQKAEESLKKTPLPPQEQEKADEEVIESISDDDAKKYDEILAKPENLELKKAVLAGGNKAMAEFVKSYQESAPVDVSVASVFTSLKRKKTDFVSKASVAKMVKSLFDNKETEDRNKLPATSPAGSPSDRETKTKKVSPIGTVTTDFFRKDKTTV